MQTLPDIRAFSLPTPFTAALLKLVIRTLEISESNQTGNLIVAARLSSATIGTSPTFGQLAIPSISDWSEAIKTERMATSSVRVHELVDLLKMIDPTTPVCDVCGEFAINQIGGKFMALAPNELCPFCLTGHVHIEPMILRTVNWATGELVAPNVEYDSHSRVGLGIPLTDEAIVKWAGEIHPSLKKFLETHQVSIHGCLAHAHLRARAFATIEEAPGFLSSAPFRSDIHSEDLVREAARFLDEREITNLPHKKFLSDGRRRDAFTPITIGGRTYLIEGKIGDGDKCDVYRGRWDHEPTERVVVKIARANANEKPLRNERKQLESLATSDVQGVEFFRQLLPEIISFGRVQDPNGQTRSCVVYRDRNGFDWTLADVMREFPNGIEPQTMVWMFNRTLMLLGWMHEHGLVHGALTPRHMLIHPKYHGLMFLDLAYAGRVGEPLRPAETSHELYRPDAALTHGVYHPMIDICMAARVMISVLGGNLETRTIPEAVPDPIISFLSEFAFRDYPDEWNRTQSADQIAKRFGAVAESVYGPRKYHPFIMPIV